MLTTVDVDTPGEVENSGGFLLLVLVDACAQNLASYGEARGQEDLEVRFYTLEVGHYRYVRDDTQGA